MTMLKRFQQMTFFIAIWRSGINVQYIEFSSFQQGFGYHLCATCWIRLKNIQGERNRIESRTEIYLFIFFVPINRLIIPLLMTETSSIKVYNMYIHKLCVWQFCWNVRCCCCCHFVLIISLFFLWNCGTDVWIYRPTVASHKLAIEAHILSLSCVRFPYVYCMYLITKPLCEGQIANYSMISNE